MVRLTPQQAMSDLCVERYRGCRCKLDGRVGDCVGPRWGITAATRWCLVTTDQLELFGLASEWTLGNVAGAAAQLGAETPCDDWAVRDVMSHMLETQQYFVASAQGLQVSPPSPVPTMALGDDPVADFQQARADTLRPSGRRESSTGPVRRSALRSVINSFTVGTWPGQQVRTKPCLWACRSGLRDHPRPVHGRTTQRHLQTRGDRHRERLSTGSAAGLQRSQELTLKQGARYRRRYETSWCSTSRRRNGFRER